MTQVYVDKKLPAVYSSWHALKLEPRLRGSQGGVRNPQESKTLCEVADEPLCGRLLPALMTVLGRLNAIAEVTENDGNWHLARHHELVQANDLGMLTREDRENASRDQRDFLRIRPEDPRPKARAGKGASKGRGRGLPGQSDPVA